jgi:hypothetical protein
MLQRRDKGYCNWNDVGRKKRSGSIFATMIVARGEKGSVFGGSFGIMGRRDIFFSFFSFFFLLGQCW